MTRILGDTVYRCDVCALTERETEEWAEPRNWYSIAVPDGKLKFDLFHLCSPRCVRVFAEELVQTRDAATV